MKNLAWLIASAVSSQDLTRSMLVHVCITCVLSISYRYPGLSLLWLSHRPPLSSHPKDPLELHKSREMIYHSLWLTSGCPFHNQTCTASMLTSNSDLLSRGPCQGHQDLVSKVSDFWMRHILLAPFGQGRFFVATFGPAL